MSNSEAELTGFLAKYTPEIAARGGAIIARLRRDLPGANVLVYDNYNALAVGFAANEKVSGVILSVALYPRWVSLFMSASLDDPTGILKGSGGTVQHVVLDDVSALDRPDIAALVAQAVARAQPPLDPGGQGKLVIKSISAKQRPRRPG
ncbi:MAG: hypothetical protein KGL54_08985 [Sphingomonadales bacterium]|nr:hypothetical protein [Sphingomonadales bacterium]